MSPCIVPYRPGLLEGTPVQNVSRRPSDVLSCRRNIHAALQALHLLPERLSRALDARHDRQGKGCDPIHPMVAWQIVRWHHIKDLGQMVERPGRYDHTFYSACICQAHFLGCVFVVPQV